MEDAAGGRRSDPGSGGMGARGALSYALDQELSYLDTLVKLPFQMARRSLERKPGPWTGDVEEALGALEGMFRLPLTLARSLSQPEARSH